jgi:alkylation response protein AidB-like acyl-CoA dehydrogenase
MGLLLSLKKEAEMEGLNFELSDEQKMIKEGVRSLFKKFEKRKAELREKIIKRKEFPQEVWDEIAKAGYIGSVIPPEYGGTGSGLLTTIFTVEEMSSLGFGNALLILTVVDACCILKNGSEELKRRFLPKIAEGKYKCALGVTEADAGTNTFRIKTFAQKKNGYYVINGSKTFITGADVADYIMLVTRTVSYTEVVEKGLPKAYGLTLFMVDLKSKGITINTLPMRGIEGTNQCTIFFEDVEVPAENMIGEENAGAFALFKGLNPERILAAASAVGLSEFCLNMAVEYAKERKVFRDTPIGAYQAIQHPLAEVKVYQEAVRLLTYRAGWAFDRDMEPGVVGAYANMAKYLGAELAIMAVDRAIETLGGNGFSEENTLIYIWEAARLLKTAPVSKEMILNYISEHVLGLPRSY